MLNIPPKKTLCLRHCSHLPPSMDTPSSPSSLQPLQYTTCFPTKLPCTAEPEHSTSVDSVTNHSNPTVENPPSSSKPIMRNKKKKKRVSRDAPAPLSMSSSSSSSSSSLGSSQRVAYKRRNPKVMIRVVRLSAVRRNDTEVEAMALPIGMSFAAVVAQVLERKDAVGERMSVEHLSTVCTSAVRESLANVFGDRFNCFARNFEKSFGSTLSTLRLINESSINKGGCHLGNLNLEGSMSDATPCMSFNERGDSTSTSGLKDCHLETKSGCHLGDLNLEGSMSDATPCMSFNERGDSTSTSGLKDCHLETLLPNIATEKQLDIFEEVWGNMPTYSMSRELVLLGQTNLLGCVSPSTLGSIVNRSLHGNFEKSVMEQTRSNDLKTLELSLIMKKMKMKETQLALNFDSNHLERSKLAMGISKASFKAEKFKNQLEDTRYAELLRKCIDCLVAGLIIMSASIAYGTYVYSFKRITEATAFCTPTQETKSWWMPRPLATVNSGLHILVCQVQVVSRMLFGVLMILAIAYLLLQRSSTSRQTMPVTYIVMLLGVACGFAGKLCIDTLGGSGYHWLLYWETLCSLHFFSNVCTSALFHILHGPVDVSQRTNRKATVVPYWIRRFLFYAIVLLLPLLCGLLPFASPGQWKDHFSLVLTDFPSIS